MLVLVLDTATPAVTAGLVEVGRQVRVRAERTTVNAKGHGELLAPAIEALLGEVGVSPADLAAVVAGTGPGPFTGLRVGLVTAAAFADAVGLPVYGVGTLDALAWAADHRGRLLVVTDARRREVYWAVYEGGQRIGGPAVGALSTVETDGVTLAIGDGARANAAALPVPVRSPWYPSVGALAAVARDRLLAGGPAEPLRPQYLRRPDAVVPGPPKEVTPR